MNDDELDALLKAGKADMVDDDGFSARVAQQLGPRRRNISQRPVLLSLAAGVVLAALLPSGGALLLASVNELLSGKATLNAALVVAGPLALLCFAGATMLADER